MSIKLWTKMLKWYKSCKDKIKEISLIINNYKIKCYICSNIFNSNNIKNDFYIINNINDDINIDTNNNDSDNDNDNNNDSDNNSNDSDNNDTNNSNDINNDDTNNNDINNDTNKIILTYSLLKMIEEGNFNLINVNNINNVNFICSCCNIIDKNIKKKLNIKKYYLYKDEVKNKVCNIYKNIKIIIN